MNQIIADILSPDMTANRLRIGGLTPLSSEGFPGELAAVIYVQGCGFRCQYCHNGHLVDTHGTHPIAWSSVIEFLEQDKATQKAVVFSGGEPTLQAALLPAIDEVKALGYKVGLHTSGAAPLQLARVLPKLDWVGFDIKGLIEHYDDITGVDAGSKCWQSLRILLNSGIDYEVRTTVHWQLLSADTLVELGKRLREEGVQNFVVQECQTEGLMMNPDLGGSILDRQQKSVLWQTLAGYFPSFDVR